METPTHSQTIRLLDDGRPSDSPFAARERLRDHHDDDGDTDTDTHRHDGHKLELFGAPSSSRYGDGGGSSGGTGRAHRLRRRLRRSVFSVLPRRCPSIKHVGCTVAALVALTLLVLIPFMAVQTARAGSVGWTSFLIAGFFVVLTVPISLLEIVSHLTNWYAPDVQKYVVRILWMVPLYSLTSWSSLRFQEATGYTDPLRDLYEAFVISSFVYYMIALLGGEESLSETLRRKDPTLGDHPWPLRLVVPRWEMGHEFMLHCKLGTLQFIVVKTVTTIVYVVLRPLGMYSEGTFDLRNAFTYVSLMLSASMSWAIYCLVKLFVATKEELRHPKDWRPIGKFLCIKGVVFFTFWQGVLLVILRNAGVIGPIGDWDAHHVADGLQDLIVCVEMLGFAIAHHFTFTYKDYLLDGSDRDSSDSVSEGEDDGRRRQQGDNGDAYLAPTIRQLNKPLSVSHALWSSTVPGETLSDIARLSMGTAYASRKSSSEEIQFHMASAESI